MITLAMTGASGAASIASGSAVPKAMIVCPCSCGILAAIASGLSCGE